MATPEHDNGETPRQLLWEDAQREWLEEGERNGWCSAPVCATRDGLPSTRENLLAWEEGGDPCEHAVRLWRYGEREGEL